MRQLTGIDSFFLDSETAHNYNHVAALGIYDPSTAPGGKVRFKEILAHFQRRVDTTPALRRRLVTTPMGIDRPYWIDAADMDIEFHVRHIALPQPGDWRQLMIQVARLHSRPLDRSRPMWEVYIIGGLDNIPDLPQGAFALFCKFHHAQFDGAAVAHLLGRLHWLSADPDEIAYQAPTAIIAERDPLLPELYARALANSVKRVGTLARFAVTATRTASNLARRAIDQYGQPGDSLDGRGLKAALGYGKAPHTRFNGKISANRAVEAVPLPFAQIKRIRTAFPEATMNDVFLTICGGALRNYLKSKNELPAESLRALMPISIRTASGDAGKGNEVGGAAVKLRTDIADPVERLHAVREEAAAAKRGAEIVGPEMVQAINEALPFSAASFLMRKLMLDQLNCTVSNVRGPDMPLFIAGARAVHFYPVSIPMDGVALNYTGFSYNNVLWISSVSCRNMVPDPGFMAQCLRDAGAELLAAAEAVLAVGNAKTSAPTARPRASAPPKARTAKTPNRRKVAARATASA